MSTTDFEIQEPDAQSSAQPIDPFENEEVPESLLSEEERAERQRLLDEEKAATEARKAEETQALLDKFKGFVGVLEEAPARQAPAEAAPQLPPQPTQAQIDEWNDKLRELSVTNPLQYAAMLREGAIEEAQRRIMGQAGGVIEGAAQGFIERFKSEKKGESRFFNQIEKLFDKEVSDIPAQAMLQMSAAQRKAEMTRRWKAAAGEFFESNAKPAQHLPTSGSSGGRSVAPSNGNRRREKEVELTDGEKVALMRSFTMGKTPGTPGYDEAKKKALNEVAKIEYGMA